MPTNKSSTWGHVVTLASHHQSHSCNYVTSLIHLQLATKAFKHRPCFALLQGSSAPHPM